MLTLVKVLVLSSVLLWALTARPAVGVTIVIVLAGAITVQVEPSVE